MKIELTPAGAKALAALVANTEAMDRARAVAPTLPEPGEADLAELAAELGRAGDSHGDDDALGDLTPPTDQDWSSPAAPTARERQLAQHSRAVERIRYARQGRRVAFGRHHCTEGELKIAGAMALRSPGTSFDTALAMLRAPRR